MIEDGVTALVVPERDAEAIASAVRRIRSEPGLGAQMGAAARESAGQRFGWERTAEQFESAYRAALALPRRRR